VSSKLEGYMHFFLNRKWKAEAEPDTNQEQHHSSRSLTPESTDGVPKRGVMAIKLYASNFTAVHKTALIIRINNQDSYSALTFDSKREVELMNVIPKWGRMVASGSGD